MLLAAATLLSFAACGTTKPAEQTTDAATTTGTEDVIVDPSMQNTLKTADAEGIETYNNPLITPKTKKAWSNYGVGDPFVMRWNGTYYLYCSTKDGERGIQVWSSPDLVTWTYEKLCAKEVETTGAYAPEVTYYNGYFYMVTSPAGNGHYVLKSDSPLGPFKIVTENFGHSIDGHIFIDNNGKWYFYSAGGESILAYEMSSPTKVSNTAIKTGAYMNGWTEGPMVIYNNGIYYLTYTGNHVWSKGYRIDYATSTKSPTAFKMAKNSPLLVNTDDDCYGIGHSSTVMGPDLDSYYIVYHTTAGAVPQRDMRTDRLVFNGTYMEVLGPSVDNQQKPEMPDVYSYFTTGSDVSAWNMNGASLSDSGLVLANGTKVLTNDSFGNLFTVEANFLSISGGKAGIIFGYKDDNNYGKAVFDTENSQLIVTFVVDGVADEQKVDLVKSFNEDYNFSALQLLTVKREDNTFTFFVNNRELCTFESALGSGSIGVIADGGNATVGFTGVTGEANGSSIRNYYKPVEGNIQAITCIETYYETTTKTRNGQASLVTGTDKYYNYTVNVTKDGKYDITIKYTSTEDTGVEIYQNGSLLTTVTLPSTEGKTGTYVVHNLELTAGFGMISFRYISGGAEVTYYNFALSTEITAISNDFSKSKGTASYVEGKWTVNDGVLNIGNTDKYGYYGKILYGEESWANYTVSVDITTSDDDINLGILVRAKNAATTESSNIAASTNYYEGYYVGLTKSGVTLGRNNYKWDPEKSKTIKIKNNTTYNLTVQVEDATIKVWLDGDLVIEYTDTEPYTHGMVGLRCCSSKGSFDNFTVTPG